MIRIGGLSERHDRRAQKEGFADKECDSDDGLFDEEDSTSMVPPSVNSNRHSLTGKCISSQFIFGFCFSWSGKSCAE